MNGLIVLYDTKSGEQIGKVNFEEPISDLNFNQSGDRILVNGFRGSTRVYATAGLKQIGPTITVEGMARAGAFVDAEHVAIALPQKNSVQIFHLPTGESKGEAMEQILPDFVDVFEDRVIASGDQGEIRMWDLRTRKELMPAIVDAQLMSLCFSPDGKRFAAAAPGFAKIWDGLSGELIANLPHPTSVDAVEFSRDSRLAATASHDDIVRLWHLPTGKRIGPAKQLFNVTEVRFDEINRLHYTAQIGDQYKMFIWQRPPEKVGTLETLKLWANAKTGLTLQPDGNHRFLSLEEWNEVVRRLGESAGSQD